MSLAASTPSCVALETPRGKAAREATHLAEVALSDVERVASTKRTTVSRPRHPAPRSRSSSPIPALSQKTSAGAFARSDQAPWSAHLIH